MPDTPPSFDDLAWTSTAPGSREKTLHRDGRVIRLVELTDAFVADAWCTTGHLVTVLEGTLELTFDDRMVTVEAGDLCSVPSGDEHRHRPCARTPIVRMLVFDEA